MKTYEGKTVVVMCANYIYSGVLVASTMECVVLRAPKLVYETGEWSDKTWKAARDLPCPEMAIERTAIEAIFPLAGPKK